MQGKYTTINCMSPKSADHLQLTIREFARLEVRDLVEGSLGRGSLSLRKRGGVSNDEGSAEVEE